MRYGYDEYKGLLVCSLSIDSLLKHFDEIKVILDEYEPHILGLNETRLNDDVEDDDLFMEGHSIVRRDRNRDGRGVAIHISDDILTIQDMILILVLNLFQFRLTNFSLNLSSLHVCTDHLAVKLPFSKILKHFLAFLIMNTLNFQFRKILTVMK